MMTSVVTLHFINSILNNYSTTGRVQDAASVVGTDECACCADSPKARDEATGICVGNDPSDLWFGAFR